MKFVIKLPTEADDTDDEEEYLYTAAITIEVILSLLLAVYPKARVTLDDRPEPNYLDLIDFIEVGHSDGSTCTGVTFTNGTSFCSCNRADNKFAFDAPNLREA